MTRYHKSRSGRRSTSQKSTTAIIANNCNNIVINVLGSVFGSAQQRCEIS